MPFHVAKISQKTRIETIYPLIDSKLPVCVAKISQKTRIETQFEETIAVRASQVAKISQKTRIETLSCQCYLPHGFEGCKNFSENKDWNLSLMLASQSVLFVSFGIITGWMFIKAAPLNPSMSKCMVLVLFVAKISQKTRIETGWWYSPQTADCSGCKNHLKNKNWNRKVFPP